MEQKTRMFQMSDDELHRSLQEAETDRAVLSDEVETLRAELEEIEAERDAMAVTVAELEHDNLDLIGRIDEMELDLERTQALLSIYRAQRSGNLPQSQRDTP